MTIWKESSSTTKPAIADSLPWLKKLKGRSTIDRAFLALLAEWILDQKCRRGEKRLFVFGVNGSIGQGKTTFCEALAKSLNARLPRHEGKALTRSLDDYYLPRSRRYAPEFLARGYDPRGIPNRGPAGTHDTRRLWKDIRAFEKSTAASRFSLPIFDKQNDERSPRSFQFQGKVAIFILEGWFVGADTRVNVGRTKTGLKRSVARALRSYRPIFDRLDALWLFKTPSTRRIAEDRIKQQMSLNRDTGRKGMSPRQIRRFVQYFYKDAWQPGVTSPIPPAAKVTFYADVNPRHRFISVRAG